MAAVRGRARLAPVGPPAEGRRLCGWGGSSPDRPPTPEGRKASRCAPVVVDMSSARPVAPPVSRLVRSVLATYARSPGRFALVLGCLGYQVAFNLFVPLMTGVVFDDILPHRDLDGFVLVVAALGGALL